MKKPLHSVLAFLLIHFLGHYSLCGLLRAIRFLKEYPMLNEPPTIHGTVRLLKLPALFRHIVGRIHHTVEFYLLPRIIHKFLLALQAAPNGIYRAVAKVEHYFETSTKLFFYAFNLAKILSALRLHAQRQQHSHASHKHFSHHLSYLEFCPFPYSTLAHHSPTTLRRTLPRALLHVQR